MDGTTRARRLGRRSKPLAENLVRVRARGSAAWPGLFDNGPLPIMVAGDSGRAHAIENLGHAGTVKLREHYSPYVASVEGVPQDPLVRFSKSTPSAHSCATDGRSRRLKVSADSRR